jgi:hypothetical protein
MNRLICNSLLFLFIIVILGCTFSTIPYEEGFIPKMVKETYRPLERNVRRNLEGFYDKSSTDISNLFRKFGIL